MKRILQAVVVAALFAGAQSAVSGTFPGNGDVVFLEPAWTYADRHAEEIAKAPSLNPFPGNGDVVFLEAKSTYADRHAGEIATTSDSPYPGNGDVVFLAPEWTYADRIGSEPDRQARAATDPALSQ